MKVLAQLRKLHIYENFIRCEDGRPYFVEYLKQFDDTSEKLVLFLNAVDILFACTQSAEREEAVKNLVDTFLAESGEYHLDLPESLKKSTMDNVNNYLTTSDKKSNRGEEDDMPLFDDAICAVHVQLKTKKFKKFIKSDEFQNFIWYKNHELRRKMAKEKEQLAAAVSHEKKSKVNSTDDDLSQQLATDQSFLQDALQFDPSKAIITWSVEEVALFLCHIGLANYAQVFVDEDIAGDVLLDMSTSDLQNMGMSEDEAQIYHKNLDQLSMNQEKESHSSLKHSADELVIIKCINTMTKQIRMLTVSTKKPLGIDELWDELNASVDERNNSAFTTLDSDGDSIQIKSDDALALMMSSIARGAKKNQIPMLKLYIKKK